jgi:hypothetical protein
LLVKKDFVRELRIRFLLASFFFEGGKHFARGLLGGFFGSDAHGATGLKVNEGGGDLSPIAEFEGAFAEAAAGDERDGVGDAAVNFNVGDEALAFCDRVVDAELAEAKHGKAHSENLSSAKMAVGLGGKIQIFSQGFHKTSLPSEGER